jgi:nucleoside-diphosphate-sugar epimerase
LVTGAGGFIGQALARALTRAGHDVIAVQRSDGDVTEPATWQGLPAVDHVFHLAGRSFVPESWRDPGDFLHTNVDGTARALEYCRARRAHLVFVSAYVYGQPKRLPIHENDPIEPNNPYALSKYLAEQVCAFFATHISLPVTVLRPFNVIGCGQRSDFLIPTLLAQIRKGEAIRVKDLHPRRDYIFLEDLVDALIRAIDKPEGFRVLNIGSGVSHSVRDVIDLLQHAADIRLPVLTDADPRPHEIADVRADITRARTVLGWEPRHTLADAIARIVEADRIENCEEE